MLQDTYTKCAVQRKLSWPVYVAWGRPSTVERQLALKTKMCERAARPCPAHATLYMHRRQRRDRNAEEFMMNKKLNSPMFSFDMEWQGFILTEISCDNFNRVSLRPNRFKYELYSLIQILSVLLEGPVPRSVTSIRSFLRKHALLLI